MGKYSEILEALESHVRKGEFKKVEAIFKQIEIRRIPRAQALPIANLARRVNKSVIALRILNPIIHAEPHSGIDPATPHELIEYAESLRKLGAVDEAQQILLGVNSKDHPRALFHLALCCFSKWKYDDAIPILRSYVQADLPNEYARLVGNVNLAAALIHQRDLDEAAILLAQLRSETKRGGHDLLLGNSLELSAQLAIQNGDFSLSQEYLREAGVLLADANDHFKAWILKWQAIAASLAANSVTPELMAVREFAASVGHWETLRDCTFYIARLNRDAEAMNTVYFGTPHAAYRETILRTSGSWYQPPSEHIFEAREGTTKQIFDIGSGKVIGTKTEIEFGQLHHRLLVLAASDFFKPLPMLAAFGQLFPNEYFNSMSSPGRVHQTVKRLRKFLRSFDSGLWLTEEKGSYKLEINGTTALRVTRDHLPLDTAGLKLEVLVKHFGSEPFSVSEARAVLGGSTSTVQRTLRSAVDQKKLKVISAGPSTRYVAPGPQNLAKVA